MRSATKDEFQKVCEATNDWKLAEAKAQVVFAEVRKECGAPLGYWLDDDLTWKPRSAGAEGQK